MSRLGFALLLQRRIARRDLPLLVVTALLTAIALVCALGAPRLLAGTLDAAVQQSVTAAGSSADLVVRSEVGDPAGGGGEAQPLMQPAEVVAQAALLRPALPEPLQSVVLPATTAVVGPQLTIGIDDVRPALRNGPIGVRVALLARPDAVRLASGALPATASSDAVDVVLSAATARAASLQVGSVVDVPAAAGLIHGTSLRLRVTGIVDRRTVAAPSPWTDSGPVWVPQEDESGSGPSIGLTVLTDVAGLARATAALGPFTAALRLHVDAARLTAAETPDVADGVALVRAHPDHLAGSTGNAYSVRSALPEAVAQAEHQAASARAQADLLTAGVLGTAAVALLLLGGLLASRRRDPIALQRARGASLWSLALPALVESVALLVVAAVVGLLSTGAPWTAGATAVAVVALLAAPAQVARTARGAAVRRAPANRADRAGLARVRRARRVALEVGVVLVAVIGLLVLQSGRGLGSAGSDPLLIAVPLLAAVALTVVLLRLLPPVVAGVVALARRSRGVAGVLVATRSGAGLALPLLALCLASGLALNDGMLVATIARGQVAASWERVGADARASTAARVAGRAGVRHAATVAELPGISANLATSGATVTVLGVDRGYAGLAGALPDAAPGTAATLRKLGDPAGTLPVVVDAALARSMAGRSLQLQIESRIIQARAVGVVASGPSGYLPGPFVLVDLAALHRRVPSVQADTTLVIGPGAGAALRRSGVPAGEVLTRSAWLATQRAAPLVSGTRVGTLLAALLLAVLAAVALTAAILAGAPERRRVLSLLRTLGMRRRTGWWLLVSDLLPLVVGGLVGGAVIGVIAAEVLDPALVLTALTGGSADPPVTISGAVLAAVLGGTVLVLACAVVAEALTWRRDRITEVLRVGGEGS